MQRVRHYARGSQQIRTGSGRGCQVVGRTYRDVTEIVPRSAFNLRRCPRTHAPSGRKNCPERTGLLLGTERHWSHCGSAKGSPGIPPRRPHRLCGASEVPAQKAASTQKGIPTMSLKKLPSHKTRRTGSKQAQVLAMLHSKQGATIATMMEATG